MKAHKLGTVLIVDDDQKTISLLQDVLAAEGYSTLTATSGDEAIQIASMSQPDIIIMDIMMPGMSGYEATEVLKASARTRLIPIILLTGLGDRASRLKGLYAGAEEFLRKPVDRVELIVRVRNLLRIKVYGDLLADQNRFLEHQVYERTAQLKDSQLSIIMTLGRAAEYKDDDSGNHVRRIGHFTRIIAQQLGMDKEFNDAIAAASPLHDVGKIWVPDSILLKPEELTEDEWKLMQKHTTIGARILGKSNWPLIWLGREIALSHHERWDGSGYPEGLIGEAIPLAARITNICDQYDTLRCSRPYRAAKSHEESVQIIMVGDNRTHPEHFDPQVLDAFIASREQFREIFEQYAD